MNSRQHSQKGFSMLELAVALAIVAILASAALPSFMTWQNSSRLRGSAMNLMADLEAAKMRAIRENTFIVVQFTAGGYTIFIDNGEGGGSAGDWIRNGGETLVQDRRLPAGVSIKTADLTVPNARIRFNGRGFPPDLPATEIISLENKAGTKRVALNRLGNVRAQ